MRRCPGAGEAGSSVRLSAETRRVAAALGFACAVQGVSRVRLDANPNLTDEPASLLLHNLLQPTRAPSLLTLSGCRAGDLWPRKTSFPQI